MQRLQVLVIDDASIIRNFIRYGLGEVLPQVEILEAANGRYAQSVLNSKPVDLVLCDWEMPEINGQELLLWIRSHERLRNLPFIMVTGRGERSHVVAALRAGIDGYVVKPFNIDTLAKQIREVLAKRGLSLTPSVSSDAVVIPTNQPGPLPVSAVIPPKDLLPDSLPPFNLTVAIARMAGKRDLVRRSLVNFHESFRNAPAEFERLITEGQRDELQRLVHTLKGVAATLEAVALTKAAATLEDTLLNHSTNEIRTLVDAVNVELVHAVAAAAQVLPVAESVVTESPPLPIAIDYRELNRLVAELRTLLAKNSTKSREAVIPLRKILDGTNLDSHLNTLVGHLDRFNFRGAENVLITLTAAFGVVSR